mgnify:CR=1 FL=1
MTTLEEVRRRAESDARARGYYLNPDAGFLNDLLEGLKSNEDRYGYPSCPCRLAAGQFDLDRDIICPCDYRDPDVEEYGNCYCALYVRKEVFEGTIPIKPIPERRPERKITSVRLVTAASEGKPTRPREQAVEERPSSVGPKIWYCKQCGYMCFREDPPYVCPICKAKRELFVEVKISTQVLGQ